MSTPTLSPDRAATDALPAIAVGDTVVAEDGPVGHVERVLRADAGPEFVVVSVRSGLRRRHPVVSCELVAAVDPQRDVVHVRGRSASIRGLSEALPLLL